MVYQTLSDFNVTGLSTLIVYVSVVTRGIFPKALLTFIWAIFTFGHYFIQKNNIGSGDFPQSLAIGGFFLAISSVFLRIIDTGISGYSIISGYTLAICIVVSGASVLFFLFSRDG